jgi:hypothetical protein
MSARRRHPRTRENRVPRLLARLERHGSVFRLSDGRVEGRLRRHDEKEEKEAVGGQPGRYLSEAGHEHIH